MIYVAKPLNLRRSWIRTLLLIVAVFAAASKNVDAEVMYGTWTFQDNVSSGPGVNGYLVANDGAPFCQFPFYPFDPNLYVEPDAPPGTWVNDPVTGYTFTPDSSISARLQQSMLYMARISSSGEYLFRVASFPDGEPRTNTFQFATSGTLNSGYAPGSDPAWGYDASTPGGGRYLATNFALGTEITAASFGAATDQAVLMYTNPGSHVEQGNFSPSINGGEGYVGFYLDDIADTGLEYYGWLHLTDIILDSTTNNYGFRLLEFAMRGTGAGETPGIVVGSSTPGQFSAVPEPGVIWLMGGCVAVCAVRRYRLRRRAV